jgi:hypothetical protein
MNGPAGDPIAIALERGLASDGTGATVSFGSLRIGGAERVRLLFLGECGACMRLQIAQIPTKTRNGLVVVTVVSNQGAYKSLRSSGKPVLYDGNMSLHSRLKAHFLPRSYIADRHGRIVVAETGFHKEDQANGFEPL